MSTVRVRNNSLSLRTLPPIGDVNGLVKGPLDSIRLAPGTVTSVEVERLNAYRSPAFEALFEEGKNGERPDLEIVRDTVPLRSLDDLRKEYDLDALTRPAPSNPVAGTLDAPSALDVVNAPAPRS